jgi:hypothetical protein
MVKVWNRRAMVIYSQPRMAVPHLPALQALDKIRMGGEKNIKLKAQSAKLRQGNHSN